jgi:hypothetical protein
MATPKTIWDILRDIESHAESILETEGSVQALRRHVHDLEVTLATVVEMLVESRAIELAALETRLAPRIAEAHASSVCVKCKKRFPTRELELVAAGHVCGACSAI